MFPIAIKRILTLTAIADGSNQGRNTVAECYSKILDDLNFCRSQSSLKGTLNGNAKIVRATKKYAVAYKTRVYLHMWTYKSFNRRHKSSRIYGFKSICYNCRSKYNLYKWI